MPTYDYECRDCGGFDALRPLAQRNEPAGCPVCGAASPRVFIGSPRLGLLEEGARRAMDVNERARHEPKRSSDYQRLSHPAGCGCCGTGRSRKATATAADGVKSFPNKRPWMIGH